MDVTVIIPTFRRGAAIGPTLESALAQEGVDVEVILIDDASGDASRGELERWASPRLTILDQPENGGPAAARQRGTELATSPVVAYLDHDDVWAPDHLRACLDAMATAGARWAYGGITWVDASLRPLHDQPLLAPAGVLDALWDDNALVTPSAMVVRRDLVLEVGGWDPRLPMVADWDLALRLAAFTAPAAAPGRTVSYVRHGDALSRTALERFPAEVAVMVDKHAELARRHHARIGTAGLWRLLGYEYRAAGDRGASARSFLRAARADRRPVDALRALKVLLRG